MNRNSLRLQRSETAMKKGFFFTLDAMLGIAMVTMLLGTVVILGLAAQKGGTQQALLHSAAADAANKKFLNPTTAGPLVDSPSADAMTVNCREMYEYVSGGKIGDGATENTPKVKKCASLG